MKILWEYDGNILYQYASIDMDKVHRECGENVSILREYNENIMRMPAEPVCQQRYGQVIVYDYIIKLWVYNEYNFENDS